MAYVMSKVTHNTCSLNDNNDDDDDDDDDEDNDDDDVHTHLIFINPHNDARRP